MRKGTNALWCYGLTFKEEASRSQVSLIVFDPVVGDIAHLALSKGMKLEVVEPSGCEVFKEGYEKFKLSVVTRPTPKSERKPKQKPAPAAARRSRRPRVVEDVIPVDDTDSEKEVSRSHKKRAIREVSVTNTESR